MTSSPRILLAAALVIAAVCSFAVESCGASSAKPAPAQISANYFLSHYVDGSGRVIRYDQGNTTVSEGQAYAMLLAVAVGNRDKFDRVWSWTQHHLRRREQDAWATRHAALLTAERAAISASERELQAIDAAGEGAA